ncbi:DUF2813 domain-containing protein [Clostridium botulinum]|nr:DUF2813 domain-containing protein [Clostridium botulinum]
MFISEVKIRGFRNFKDDTISFKNKSLIIGQNDIGKSNLIYALRILLDGSISEINLEPKVSDFYVFEETNELSIQVKFSDIKEDCILAKFKGSISDQGEMYLRFNAIRDIDNSAITYYFSKGKDVENLNKEENKFETRYYLKTLNLQYVKSNRNLEKFISKEKKNLLLEMMDNRNDTQKKDDNEKVELVKEELVNVNNNVRELSYIKNATNKINVDLKDLSNHNKNQVFQFSTVAESIDDIQSSVELVAKINNRELSIGGDGRNNQIFMSLWCNKHDNIDKKPLNVTLYCIEEPEAHLHPHQQRQLSKFLLNVLNGQVIISTHSPQIASEFEPGSIIRLSNYKDGSTKAANNGCSDIISDAINSFGYRMNIIASEAFFSRVVLLVEGPSEEIFYKTLAHKLDINLDKNGISIIDVNGVGFDEYMQLLKSLDIKYVFRTDNDIFKVPYNERYRCAGVQRAINFYRKYYIGDNEIEKLLEKEYELNNLPNKLLKSPIKEIVDDLTNNFKRIGIFLSDIDLENDIYESGISDELKAFYSTTSKKDTINKMKEKKAINLYRFLKENEDILDKINNSHVVEPLYKCVEMSESYE